MHNKYFSSLKFIYKGVLGYVAYCSIFPLFLAPLLNKIRGVNISSILKVYIASGVVIDTLYPELVTIENDVIITRGCKIITHYNPTEPQKEILNMDTMFGKVLIKRGAFIGVNAIILPNVVIGECALVNAGSVVKNNVPDYAVVEGNPARIISDIRGKKH